MSSEPVYRNSGWDQALAKSKARNTRAKWIAIGSLIALLVIIGIGVGVGVGVSQSKKNNNNSSSSSSSSGSSPGSTTQTDPNDPSTFTKDPDLHRAFYGIAYTPEGSLLPDCGNSLEGVIKDIQLLSQITGRIRLYGADCNQSALVLEAIQQTKVDMQVYLGNYPDVADTTVYERQRDTLKEALQTYGADHVAGITVGNEFILNYVTDNGGDPNDSVGNTAGRILVENIKDTRDMISSLNLGKDIPVGNSDAGYYFNDLVLAEIDYGLSNVHPWFAGVTVQAASQWTFDSFDEVNVVPASQLPNKPKMYIAETGWPTDSSDTASKNNGGSDASAANLQVFMDDFVCKANEDGVGYFFFEFTDEKWKDEMFGGVEGYWGLFNGDRTLKDIKIPTCTAP